jgi:hypothetical protein
MVKNNKCACYHWHCCSFQSLEMNSHLFPIVLVALTIHGGGVYTGLVRLGQHAALPFPNTSLRRYPFETIARVTVPSLLATIRSQRTSAEKRSNLDACDTTSWYSDWLAVLSPISLVFFSFYAAEWTRSYTFYCARW